MTCIVAIECKDGAVIAGDYAASNFFVSMNVTQSKIFEHSNMLFGFTGTFRFGQIIEHILVSTHHQKNQKHMSGRFETLSLS